MKVTKQASRILTPVTRPACHQILAQASQPTWGGLGTVWPVSPEDGTHPLPFLSYLMDSTTILSTFWRLCSLRAVYILCQPRLFL